MALYYFHLRDGRRRVLDKYGVELASIADVESVALREARAIIADDAKNGRIDLRQRIDVEDATERVIFQLNFADAVTIVGLGAGSLSKPHD